MTRHTINVDVSLVNGGCLNILENAAAQEAIKYLCPDMSPPVSTYTIR
ncbi:MAG: hypothetical protein LBP83_01605 [Dysgonamonadaceae bacterium]|nr:hypothetical protein [Dysgonamonadaceae bacterium]